MRLLAKEAVPEVRSLRARRAASAAGEAQAARPCGFCITCVDASGITPRPVVSDCRTRQLRAHAAGGHAGAQIAMLGDDAVGARISYHHPDSGWKDATICAYDRVRTA